MAEAFRAEKIAGAQLLLHELGHFDA